MRYPGGKGKCFQHIVNLMPEHEVYIECFLGGAAVLRHKRPARRTIGIDLDERVLARATVATMACPALELLQADAVEYLRRYSFNGRELVYADPPYMPEVRRRSRVYRHDYTRQDHQILLETLRSLPCYVMISGYNSELYHSMLAGWRHVTFRAKTHVDVRDESVWMNYPEPVTLHDARFLGSSFRERQQIQRRLATMRRRVKAMPSAERSEFMRWMNEEFRPREESPCKAHA